MNKPRQWLEAGCVRVLLLAAPRLPRSMLLALGGAAGTLGFALARERRRITLDNLRSALGPRLSAREARRIGRACWRNFGRNLVDTVYFPRFGPASVGRWVRYEGLDHLREAYDRGRGVLVFSGHFGHWELTALMQGHLGLPLMLVTRPLDNPRLERVLAQLRGSSGNRVVHKRRAVREMLKSLRAGIGVAIVIDQDALNDGVFVPFFGRLASTTPTLARLALRTGAAVIPTFCLPQRDGTYRVVYQPEVRIPRGNDLGEDTLRLTAACTAILEDWVRRHPEHWFWMHRRWKTPPPTAGQRHAAAGSDAAQPAAREA